MTRRMSVSMTKEAVIDGTKTVTRRHIDTWKTLKPGDQLTLIEKGMGLRKGEKQRVLATVEVVSVHTQHLRDVYLAVEEEYRRRITAEEGLPHLRVWEFVRFWLDGHGYKSAGNDGIDVDGKAVQCRRIEWKYLTRICPECANMFDGTVPGHVYGSSWDWVPCPTCQGTGFVDHE